MTRLIAGCVLAGVSGIAAAVVLQAQTPPAATALPPVLIESLAGVDSFARYCAPCHGEAGTGNGPVAAALKVGPADLTTLARRNNGAFPRQRVADFVSGVARPVPAHG